jgi:hypothetical protein
MVWEPRSDRVFVVLTWSERFPKALDAVLK